MRKSIYGVVAFLAILLLFPFSVLRAEWGHFVINFEKRLYGSGAQTWQIATYDKAWSYFANRKGMVQYGDNEWTVFPLGNGSDVRSVLASPDRKRIYAGGINEFGYFAPAEDGTLRYHCMSDDLEYIGNVWGIHEIDEVLYFQGDSKVLRLKGGEYACFEMPGIKLECSSVIGDVLYVGTTRGVYFLAGDSFFPLPGGEALSSMRIRGMAAYGKGMLVATAYDGLFYYDGTALHPFHIGAEEFMRENELFCMAVRDDRIALGTIHKGVLLFDACTRQLTYFNESNGLQNNTVLSLSFTHEGNLWAGLDSGIDLICLNVPFTNLYSNPHSCGAGYAAAVRDGFLYLGTNRGLYYTSYPVSRGVIPSDIHPVAGLSGQVWNLSQAGGELFCLHDRGIFRIQGATAERVTDITGAWQCQLVKGTDDRMFVGVYDGMYLLERTGNGWQVSCKIDGIRDSGRLFVQESGRVLWIAVYDQVLRVELSEDYSHVLSSNLYGVGEAHAPGSSLFPACVDGLPVFLLSGRVWRFNARRNCLEPATDVEAMLGNAVSSCLWLQEHGDGLIALGKEGIVRSLPDSCREGMLQEIIPLRNSFFRLVDGFETMIPVSDSQLIIPHEDGFALYTPPAWGGENAGEAVPSSRSGCMRIRRMTLSYPKDSLVYSDNYLNQRPRLDIGYSFNSVRFDYTLSFPALYEDVRFCYRLNDEAWVESSSSLSKEYTNLPEGCYRFEVKALFPDGTSDTDAIDFRILSPWYRTGVAYFCYTLLLLLSCWGLYRYEERRMRHKEKLIARAKDKEMQELEKSYAEERVRQENQIMQLEKEKLEHDLRHKSQEMANLLVNFAQKNEILGEIKSEILRVSFQLKGEETREGRAKLMKLSGKIDASMQNEEVLKRIEEQFDIVHNHFMQNLRAKYPDLSPNERLMCAYLKINLTTKEIAPLLNVSLRGAETIRYRLRKKFGIEREANLVDFLNENV